MAEAAARRRTRSPRVSQSENRWSLERALAFSRRTPSALSSGTRAGSGTAAGGGALGAGAAVSVLGAARSRPTNEGRYQTAAASTAQASATSAASFFTPLVYH